jgi:RNA polymerase sigma factor (TIGR02999 family)
MLIAMADSNVTRILNAAAQGDPQAAGELLPLVYEELRRLAAQRVSAERPDQTLQATALVHEAYLRLVDVDDPQQWNGRGHFFAAAAEAMRRILVESARRRRQLKRGGGMQRESMDTLEIAAPADAPDDLLELDAALERLAGEDAQSAQLVKLRYFAGLTIPQAAEILDISPRSADSIWSFARAWLRREMSAGG